MSPTRPPYEAIMNATARLLPLAATLLLASTASASDLTECMLTGTLSADFTTEARTRQLTLEVTATSTVQGHDEVCSPLNGQTLSFEASDPSFVSPLLLIGSVVTFHYTLTDDEETGESYVDWAFERVDTPAPHCRITATYEESILQGIGAPMLYRFSHMRAEPGQHCAYVLADEMIESRDPSFANMTVGESVTLRRYNYTGSDAVMYWEREVTATAE